MSKAREAAQQQLGAIDLSYLDKEREAAKNSYNTSSTSLKTNFDNLLAQIGTNKDLTKTSFNKGRSTIAENAFNQNRMNMIDTGSRVIGKTGLRELGEVGNRIETGRQYSDVANTYYKGIKELDTTEQQGKSQYELNNRGLSDQLNQMLAGIDTRGAEAKRNYDMQVGQLAEQIQGRWDANANAQAAIAAQRAAAAAQTAAMRQAASSQLVEAKRGVLSKIADAAITNKLSTNDVAAQIKANFGVDYTTAYQVARDLMTSSADRSAMQRRGVLSDNGSINRLLGL